METILDNREIEERPESQYSNTPTLQHSSPFRGRGIRMKTNLDKSFAVRQPFP